ncbi:MAG TPA: class I SAM-dependent methyltransferase [Micromonosporaceae bacterium]|nr:class I SAM-dependent methyltransferase [Micromonosporaceae bacterium]
MTERVRARVFGEVADDYDRFRPEYPAPLVDDVLAYAGIASGDGAGVAALDVGAGTGKATLPFATRGLAVTALEPDPAMAAVLRARTADRQNVTVVESALEEFRSERRYRLLLSGQAWHWTNPATRWEQAADLVAPHGALALFWNHECIADLAARTAVTEAHRELAPSVEWDPDPIDEASLITSWPGDELTDRPEFVDVDARAYAWSWTMPTSSYVSMQSTHSNFRITDEDTRTAMFGAITDLLGEQVELAMVTALYLARRAG